MCHFLRYRLNALAARDCTNAAHAMFTGMVKAPCFEHTDEATESGASVPWTLGCSWSILEFRPMIPNHEFRNMLGCYHVVVSQHLCSAIPVKASLPGHPHQVLGPQECRSPSVEPLSRSAHLARVAIFRDLFLCSESEYAGIKPSSEVARDMMDPGRRHFIGPSVANAGGTTPHRPR